MEGGQPMTKEQEAIEYLKESVVIYKNIIPKLSEAVETVLSMLKEKDKQIEYYKKQKEYDEQFKHELLEEIRCLNLDKDEKDKQIEQKDKMINKMIDNIMTHYQVKTMRKMCCFTCKIGERACTYSGIHRNCIKQYFERKSRE